jgi:hypothetical protein
LKNNQQTSITPWQQGAGRQISDLAPEKGDKAKKQNPNKPTQRKPNSKTGCLVVHRADLQNLRTSHTSLRKELTKQLLLKDRKKKTGMSPQPPGETKTELLLKYQHQDWMLKE